MPPDNRINVLTASAKNEVAGTLENQEHGLFTYYLLKGLQGKAGKNSGHVDLKELYEYTHAGVSAAAHRQNREQNVQLYSAIPTLRIY